MMGLMLLLIVLVACGLPKFDEKDDKSNDKEYGLNNDELIKLAIEEFRSLDNHVIFTSTPSANVTIDEMRNASNIKIWDGKYIELAVHTHEDSDLPKWNGDETYYELYKLVDGELEVFSETTAETVSDKEPDYVEENDGVLDITRCLKCN